MTRRRHIAAMRALDLTGLASRGEADRRLAERCWPIRRCAPSSCNRWI